MLRFRMFGASIALFTVLLFAGAAFDRGVSAAEISMPDNFGEAEWAAENWKSAVNYLKYVSDDEDRQKLLSVPDQNRAQAWQEFWQEVDPVKSTDANEYRDAYFDRVRHANDEFTTPLREGWLTDLGEAWIRMGEPDFETDYTMRRSGRDVIIWEYHRPRQVDLVFIDESGVGNFYLVNPSAMIDEVLLETGETTG